MSATRTIPPRVRARRRILAGVAGAGFAIIGCVATDPAPSSPSSGGASARASATTPAGSSTTLGPADLGATVPDARSPITSAVTTQIRTLIASTLESGRLELDAGAAPHGVSIGVRVPGEPDLLLAAGTDAADPTTAFDARTPFRAGFVTEVTTMLLGWMLIDEGLLDPAAPIGTWLPDLPDSDRITVEMLLERTDGLPEVEAPVFQPLILGGLNPNVSAADALTVLVAGSRAAEPGLLNAEFEIATGTIALGLILEAVTGSTLAELSRQRLIDPLDLLDTTLSFPKTAYAPFGVAAWGMISTIGDQLTLAEAIGRASIPGLRRALGDDSFPVSRAVSESEDVRYAATGYPLFGYGPFTERDGVVTPTSVGRRIGGLGTTTHWYHYPSSGVTIVIHYNASGIVDGDEIQAMANRIQRLVADRAD